jgi:SWI/SNF-related matrix-associated actin-dependent regulator of chromatin subfamily A3
VTGYGGARLASSLTGSPGRGFLQDLQGICRSLHLDTLADGSLFTRTIERPIRQRDPQGLKRLQVDGGRLPPGRPTRGKCAWTAETVQHVI